VIARGPYIGRAQAPDGAKVLRGERSGLAMRTLALWQATSPRRATATTNRTRMAASLEQSAGELHRHRRQYPLHS